MLQGSRAIWPRPQEAPPPLPQAAAQPHLWAQTRDPSPGAERAQTCRPTWPQDTSTEQSQVLPYVGLFVSYPIRAPRALPGCGKERERAQGAGEAEPVPRALPVMAQCPRVHVDSRGVRAGCALQEGPPLRASCPSTPGAPKKAAAVLPPNIYTAWGPKGTHRMRAAKPHSLTPRP